MARVTVEDCIDKVDSPYELVLVAKERATQLNSGLLPTIDRDNDKNTVISLREIADEKIKVKDLIETAVYKLRKHVEQVDDVAENDDDIGDDFENLYKGEISKSGIPILPSKRARKVPEKIQVSKEDIAETLKKSEKLTQSSVKTSFATGLTLSQEDALKAQIFGCWSLPLGLPYQENLLVRIKLRLKKDGTVLRSEILDHARMNKPGQGFYKVLAESALRAIRICQPLRVPPTGYEKWKDLQLNFDANEMLKG